MYGKPGAPCPSDAEAADANETPGPVSETTAAAAASPAPPAAAAAPKAVEAAPLLAPWPGFKAVAQLLARLAVNAHTLCDQVSMQTGAATTTIVQCALVWRTSDASDPCESEVTSCRTSCRIRCASS